MAQLARVIVQSVRDAHAHHLFLAFFAFSVVVATRLETALMTNWPNCACLAFAQR